MQKSVPEAQFMNFLTRKYPPPRIKQLRFFFSPPQSKNLYGAKKDGREETAAWKSLLAFGEHLGRLHKSVCPQTRENSQSKSLHFNLYPNLSFDSIIRCGQTSTQ